MTGGFGVGAVCEQIAGVPDRPRASVVMAMRRVAMDRAEVETICAFMIASYRRRPPPPLERAREAPTLDAPRWLLLRAALLLGRLLAAPPNALLFRLE